MQECVDDERDMAAGILGLDDVCMVFHSLSTEPIAWTGAYRHSGRELD